MFSISSFFNQPQLTNTPVKVSIWHRITTPNTAPQCIHATLEVSGDYISFWNSDRCGCPDAGTRHFHSKELNTILLGDPSENYILFLKANKIHSAYQQIQQVCLRTKHLNSRIFHRPYPFDNPGVTAFLLDKGGIFNFTTYKRDYPYSSILKTVTVMGLISSFFNYIGPYFFPPDDPDLTVDGGLTSFAAELALISVPIVAREFLKLGPEFAQQVGPRMESAISLLGEEIDDPMDLVGDDPMDFFMKYVSEDPEFNFIEARMSIRNKLFQISGYGSGVAIGALAAHLLILRFGFSDYTCADIQRMVKKTQEIQAGIAQQLTT